MADQTVNPQWANEETAAFSADRANRVARNSVTSMGVSAAARDITTMRTYADTYGVAVAKTGDVTNQRQSGRCWMFSSFNVLRQEAIKKLDVDTFEFSQAYGMFYDKLEKANSALEYIIQTADQPTDSRVVNTLLTEGIGDGGYYSFAMSLVEKYGLVPKDAMPETACSKNSTQMDERIDRLFRKSAGELRAAYAAGKSQDELRALKQEQLKGFHQILSVCLGEPPLTFDFECKVGKNAQVDKAKLSLLSQVRLLTRRTARRTRKALRFFATLALLLLSLLSAIVALILVALSSSSLFQARNILTARYITQPSSIPFWAALRLAS